jgi:hypothetical protein
MIRAWHESCRLEEEIRVRFGFREAALVAVLNEVQVYVEFPECYVAIPRMHPTRHPMERSRDWPPPEASNG